MSELVSYALADGVATIAMDDGKANVFSPEMLDELHGALDRAESDGAVVVLTGREREDHMPHGWTFLTNHGHLLLAVAQAPDARVRDLAATVGISERAALTILGDLETAGYLHRTRVGRRNHYSLHPGQPFRHPTTAPTHARTAASHTAHLNISSPFPC